MAEGVGAAVGAAVGTGDTVGTDVAIGTDVNTGESVAEGTDVNTGSGVTTGAATGVGEDITNAVGSEVSAGATVGTHVDTGVISGKGPTVDPEIKTATVSSGLSDGAKVDPMASAYLSDDPNGVETISSETVSDIRGVSDPKTSGSDAVSKIKDPCRTDIHGTIHKTAKIKTIKMTLRAISPNSF